MGKVDISNCEKSYGGSVEYKKYTSTSRTAYGRPLGYPFLGSLQRNP